MIPDKPGTIFQASDSKAAESSAKQFSISKSLTVGLTLVVLAVSVAAVSLNFYFSTQRSIQSLEKKADEYISFLSNALRLSLWEFDTRSIRHIGSVFAQNEHIDILEIYDADNVNVFSNKDRSESEAFLSRSKDIYYENQLAGHVYLSLASGHYEQINHWLLLSSVMTIVFILFALYMATGFLLRKFLRKPLDELSRTVSAFAAGQGRASRSDVSCIEFQGFVDILSEMQSQINQQMADLKTAREKYQGIFEHAAQGIFQISPQGAIISANPALAEMLGIASADTLVGCPQHVWQKGFMDHNHLEWLRHDTQTTEISGFETRMRKKDKSVIWVSISVKSIADTSGRLLYHEGFLLDITERKQREKAEKESEAARLALKAKSEFLANMSHEIRTPMNAITGLAHLALKTDLSAKQYDYLSKIRQSADALLRIINDILDFSKIEAGMLTMETVEFNLESVMRNVINVTSLAAEKKGLEFVFDLAPDVPLNLVGDPLRLEQVLINLTNNAIKFTEKGHIMIRVGLDETVDQTDSDPVRLMFSVEDTGIGLSEDQKARLFQSFSQADNSVTRKFGGTGLGLAISKRLVELMKGTIDVDSTQGKGSKFCFDAVFGKNTGKTEKPFIPPRHLKGLRVLVVDDNKVARFVICDMLEMLSFEVCQASSGQEAFTELEHADQAGRPFELVVMDWRMPEIDGVEASKRIKSNVALSKIPSILMLTAYSREDIRKKAEDVGVDGFLAKPVNVSFLFDVIMEVLSKTTDSGKHLPASVQTEDVAGLDKIRGAVILLVEDNEINRQVATELMESEGFAVHIAVNGKDAIEKLEDPEFADTIDLILMDIQMPEMDGLTATRKIRQLDNRVGRLPILAMTAHALAYEREKCMEAGMNDHIPKPVDPKRLFTALVEWIKPKTDTPVKRPDRKSLDGDPADLLPDQLPGFDLNAGLGRVAGNRALLKELLFKFANKQPMLVRDLQSAISNRNVAAAKEIAHKIKGMSGNIGAVNVYETVKILEAALSGNQAGAMEAAMDGFSKAYETAKNTVLALKPMTAESTENIHDASERPVSSLDEGFDAMVKEIADLLHADYGEAIRAIKKLKQMSGNAEIATMVMQLEKAVEEFDEDGARDLLEKLTRIADAKV